jgi:hypothetical protein
MLHLPERCLLPGPGGRREHPAHGIHIAVERRTARPIALHEQDEQRSTRPQPTVQPPNIAGPKPRRQRAETGLIVDRVERRDRIPC